MTARVGGLRLTVAFVRHRVAQVSILSVLGFALGASVVGLAVVKSSAQDAILDSVRADLGQRSYVLQTGDPAAYQALRMINGVSPIQDQIGDIVADGLSAPVLVRTTTSTALELGIIVRGARPSRVGDVVLSEVTAESMGVIVGDHVQVRAGDATVDGRVVGISVDPANRTTSMVVQLVEDSTVFRPTMWLSDTDFADIRELDRSLTGRTAFYRSLDSLLEAAGSAENRPRFLSAMRFVPVGCGLLIAVLLASAGSVLARRWQNDVDALVGAGMAPAAAWRRIVAIAFGTVLLGQVLGGIAATAALWFWREPVSGWLGQFWVDITVPWQEPLFILGLTGVSAILTIPLTRVALKWMTRRPLARGQQRWTTTLATVCTAVGLVLLAALIWVSRYPKGEWAYTVAPLAAALVAVAGPFVIAPSLGVGLAVATRALVRYLVAGLRPVAAVSATIAVLSGVWSAQTVHEANIGEQLSSPTVPAGSFVISEMPDEAIPTLLRLYRSHGGNRVEQFGIPDESKTLLRATGAKVTSCMSRRGTYDPDEVIDCFPQADLTSINTVLLGHPGSPPRADPVLLEGGKAGLLLFTTGEAVASRIADTRAEADPMLGGNLPGLVIPSDGDVAKAFGLVSAGKSEVALLDFSRLAPRDQLLIRAAAIRLAPSAQTASGTDPTEYDRLRSTASIVSFLGATVVAVVVLLGGVSMVVAHSVTRRAIVDVGAASIRRWGIVGRWTAVLGITAMLTIPLTILTASLGGRIEISSFGRLWILPGLLSVVASLMVGLAFSRQPQRQSE